jgi:hypothetical protein
MGDEPTARDALFTQFFRALFVVLLLYGIGATAVVLFGDDGLARTMLTAFSSMFAGILGLGSGYLLGKNGR